MAPVHQILSVFVEHAVQVGGYVAVLHAAVYHEIDGLSEHFHVLFVFAHDCWEGQQHLQDPRHAVGSA